jgi:hypothetical protein
MAEDALCTHQPGSLGVAKSAPIEYGPAPVRAIEWEPAAEARMRDVPAFVRGMVAGRVETWCREHGIDRVTPEVLAEIREQMPTPKLFGRRSRPVV